MQPPPNRAIHSPTIPVVAGLGWMRLGPSPEENIPGRSWVQLAFAHSQAIGEATSASCGPSPRIVDGQWLRTVTVVIRAVTWRTTDAVSTTSNTKRPDFGRLTISLGPYAQKSHPWTRQACSMLAVGCWMQETIKLSNKRACHSLGPLIRPG